jgi:FKBP-type peptidyl-prolyl cis-trans isomerase 2
MVVEEGKQVALEFSITLQDGTVYLSNTDHEPLTYKHGQKELLPALEEALSGLQVDDTKQITLTPDDAFGSVNPEAFVSVQPDTIPEEARKVDTILTTQDANGNTLNVRVHDIQDEQIIIDYNHPLAGKTVVFDLRVIGIA